MDIYVVIYMIYRYMLCLYNAVLEKLSVKLENAWKKFRKLRGTLETAWEVFMN